MLPLNSLSAKFLQNTSFYIYIYIYIYIYMRTCTNVDRKVYDNIFKNNLVYMFKICRPKHKCKIQIQTI
ncbi:hypothetical protein HanXRQr2_Chr05g0197101 [Helianthus annuus]|uniref:Uncharacterized protein n=1 Tax=Helianthus annuus TaxID=4232 RepID=A0A9K3IX30_HELAN|nr:hypothetical protein HanXRQr2_Chr05g0197101 [Helianthus annuus]